MISRYDGNFRGILLLVRLRIHILKKMRQNKPLHVYFLEIVAKHRDKTALIDIRRDLSWTFAELNQMSNRFANYFRVRHAWLHCNFKKLTAV